MSITELVGLVPVGGRLEGVRRPQVQEIIRIALKELASAEEKELKKLLARYKA
jgi:hypothetical protein